MIAPLTDLLTKPVVQVISVDPTDHREADHPIHLYVVLGHLKIALAILAVAAAVVVVDMEIIGVILMLHGTKLKT